MPTLRPAYTGAAVGVMAAAMLFILGATYLTVFIISKTKHRHHKRFPSATTLAKRVAGFGCLGWIAFMGFITSSMNYISPFWMIFFVWIMWTFGLLHYYRLTFHGKEDDMAEDETIHLSSEGSASKKYQRFSRQGAKQWIIQTSSDYYFSIRNGIRKNWRRIIPINIGLLLLSLTIGLTTADLCFCQHPNEFSTRFTRMLSQDPCKSRVFCHVYFTLPEDPSTSIIANFHSSHQPSKGWIQYKRSDQDVFDSVSTTFFRAALKEVDRYIHWADIIQLEPDTVYNFRFGFTDMDGNDQISGNYSTRTIPLTGNVTFISGGDMQVDAFGDRITAMAASHSPHFAIVAGDISYANGFQECYRRWDKWFDSWEISMKTPLGHAVPMTLGIGNHEAGGDFNRPRNSIPFYFEYFPQKTDLAKIDPQQRPSYHYHKIAEHTHLLILDTGIVSPMMGDQFDWLNLQLEGSKNLSNRVVAYHYPLFPSVTRFDGVPNSEKLAWSSAFDAHGVTVAFENHFHVWKKTKSVIGSTADGSVNETSGVVYLGDGAWGIDAPYMPINRDSWWMDGSEPIPHVYVVTASERMLTADARNVDNEVFNSYTKYHPMK